MLSWFSSYLSNRQQRVVIDGQCLSWVNIKAGVPQGSALGPLRFSIYINDINSNILSESFLYVDDTSLLDIIDDPLYSSTKLKGQYYESVETL